MSYRAEEDAAREHLAADERALAALRADHERRTRELADLETLEKDLDLAIATRRGATLDGRGYVRVAVLMLAMLGAGVFEGWVGTIDVSGRWVVKGVVITVWALVAWRALREQKASKKRLEEHDARLAAAKAAAIPPTRVAEPEAEADAAPEAAARARHST